MEKGKMLSGRIFNSRVHSKNVEGKEKWLGYLLGDKSKNFFTKKSNLFFTTNQTNIPINPFSYNFYH